MNELEKIREELNNEIEKNNLDLSGAKILKISQELDRLVILAMTQKNDLISSPIDLV